MMRSTLNIFRSTSMASLRMLNTEAIFQTKPYRLHRLDSGPTSSITLKRDEALEYYRLMQIIRRMETTAGSLYREQKIRGFCHLYTGQEACAVGMKAAMDADDYLITSYRCHGWTYLMGSTVTQVLAELMGRVGGISHGKGGSMHMYGRNYLGGNGIVGAQIPLGLGLAFAIKYREQKNVSLTLYGDGAANQGQFFEVANMAQLWKLPVILICENNGYGMGTSVERASASADFYTRGDFVPGLWIDGMDLPTVKEAFRWAREYSMENGPLVVELATYRYSGHSMSDPGTSYRTREEVQMIRKTRDPIMLFKEKILTSNLATDEEIKEIDNECKKQVEDAVAEADKQPQPPMEALYTDVYEGTEPQLIRGITHDESIMQPFVTTAELLKAKSK